MVATTKHHLLFYSNTTLVKVKSKRNMESYIYGLIQIQHLLKLNMYIIAYCIACNPIQIQHLLKLNYTRSITNQRPEQFKYNTC